MGTTEPKISPVLRKTISSFHKEALGSFAHHQSNNTFTTNDWRDKLEGKAGIDV